MFEVYLTDAATFLEQGKQAVLKGHVEDARRYCRACVFCAYSALEAFVHYISVSFEQANSIEKHETAYLNDKRLSFDPTKGVVERSEYHPLEEKIRVLLRRFAPEVDLGGTMWRQLKAFKLFRDSLVHPKKPEDDIDIADYSRNAETGLQIMIDIMDLLSTKIYKKPIRRKLRDLRPETTVVTANRGSSIYK
jgi:hypothetical protein